MRWRAFIELCGHLRIGLLDGAPASLSCDVPSDVPWELVIEASSYHNVTPALAWSLRDRPDLPAHIRDYLDAVLALNGQRNATLLSALARIVAACNGIGVEPVLLKGAARLVEGTYPSPSLRILGDLDVLIPKERAGDVVAALHDIGFRPDPSDAPMPEAHHHLPMLHDRVLGGGVELHTDVAGAASREIIATDWYLAGARPSRFRDLNVRLPDPTRSVGHIVAHDQLDHEGYQDNKIELRQLLDLALIRARHADAIDWVELDGRFRGRKNGKVLATYLAMAKDLLGQPQPRLSRAPRRRAIEVLRHTIEPSSNPLPGVISQRLAALARNCVTFVRRDPSRLGRLLELRKWPGRVRFVLTAFKRAPPSW